MSDSRNRGRFGAFGDDEAWESPSIVIDLGGRLDLPEDFTVSPLRLAPADDLAAAARTAPAIMQLSVFVDWVGTGRRLGGDGELETSEQEDLARKLGLDPDEWFEADDQSPYHPQVVLLTEWASAAGLVQRRGQKLLQTAQGHNMHADALGAWRAAFDAMLELGVADPGGNGPPWGATVDAAIPDVIVLANTASNPPAFNHVVERLCSQEEELLTFDSADGGTSSDIDQAIAEDTTTVIDKLVQLGVVVRDGEVLRGTPLGTFVAVQLLKEDGFEVPLHS